MAGTADFVIGADVACSDGACGKVRRVVIDPVAEVVTHLVVEPADRQGLGRLVPLRLVEGGADEIRLSCSLAEFQRLDPAEETQFVPGTAGYAAYGPDEVFAWPYYGAGMGMDAGLGMPGVSQTVTYDTVPAGEVDIRRGDHVHATDGDIGRVQGLVIERQSHHVTHVLLQEGHLWGRRDVAIPISAVARSDDGIRLSISKDQVRDLPAVDLDHRSG